MAGDDKKAKSLLDQSLELFGPALPKGARTGMDEAIKAYAEQAQPKPQQMQFAETDPGIMPPERPAASGRGWSPVKGPKRRGRPWGSKNKSTLAMRDLLLGKFGSPLTGPMTIQSMHWRDLAEELGLKNPTFAQALELLKVQISCSLGAAPYVHSKMPLAVSIDSRGFVSLNIDFGGVATALGATDVVDGAFQVQSAIEDVLKGAGSGLAPAGGDDAGAAAKPAKQPAETPSDESEENQ